MKIKSVIFGILTSAMFSSPVFSANVSCNFFSEIKITKSGEWLTTESDFMKIYEIFGDGLELPLDNSLLGNLDSQQPFKAGTVDRGTVYLMGSDMGVEGKLISVEGENITIYDGMCSVGFG